MYILYTTADGQITKIHIITSICLSGYVDEMRNLLFSLSRTAMAAISTKYKAMVPEPLNRQFPERVDKKTAVEQHLKRKNTETSLYPPGSSNYVIFK